MANYNEHKCLACGEIYDYCGHCAVTPIVHKAEGFCSEKCSDIFNILSKHSCNLITADEALVALSTYRLDEIKLNKDIIAHIEKIKTEAGVKVEPEVVAEEVTPIVEETTVQYNKKNKKKW